METNQLKENIAQYITEKKPFMIGQIANEFEINSLEAAKHLPDGMASFAPQEEFESIWKELVSWEKCTFIVQHMGSVFEIVGKLNKGSFGRGYFNLNGSEAIHGHLKVDDIDSICFMSMPFMGLESLSVHFFNTDGEVKFSIYVGRENKVLIPEAKESFKTLQNKYAE